MGKILYAVPQPRYAQSSAWTLYNVAQSEGDKVEIAKGRLEAVTHQGAAKAVAGVQGVSHLFAAES